jgi:hypothetical protein
LLPASHFSRWLLPIVALCIGISGITVVWVAVAILSEGTCGWLALLAAMTVAVLLRLTQAPSRLARGIVAAFGCALAIALTLWMIAATHFGFMFGLGPITSALRLGPVLAWEVTRLTLRPLDWLFIALSLPLAAWWARGEKISEQRS